MTHDLLLALLAAFFGGIMNATVGGGTFLTYPILLLLGNSSIVANATSTVVLWPGIVSSLPAFKKEIKKSKRLIQALIPPALAGGLIGSFILTHTPSSLFAVVAPLLILLGSLIFMYQVPIDRFFKSIKLYRHGHRAIVVATIVFVIGIYGSYFGAGIGILLLGGLSILGIRDLYQNIAIKNVLAMVVNSVAVVYFSLSGIVHWQIVPLMALGAILGGYTGSHLVRYVNQAILRKIIVVLGFGIAAVLLVNHFR